jgi:hypothetical protein
MDAKLTLNIDRDIARKELSGAKIAPYRLATGTLSLLATGTTGRMASPVTQTPSIAVPLASRPRCINGENLHLA